MALNSPADAPTLVLVGGGHAHVEILRRLALEEHPAVRTVLVSPYPHHHYSGMTPGYLAGIYREEELALDLEALCRRAGAERVEGWASAVDVGARRVVLADGRSLPYDLASFATGSTSAGSGTPGVGEHALGIKPLSRAVAVRRRLEELAGREDEGRHPEGHGPRSVVVVGGGAGGVETAFAAARTLAERDGTADRGPGRPRWDVTLLEAGDRILSAYRDRFRRKARAALEERGVRVVTEAPVAAVEEGAVRLEDGTRRASDLTLWLTGPAAPALFAESELPVDRRGYLLVDSALRVPGYPELFAAGDCATPAEHPDTPKAGVYAVHQAPVLWESLRATLAGKDPAAEGAHFEPQQGYLSLLNVCDGTALLSWKGIAARGRWAWWLKDRIDRRFVRRYQGLYEG